MFQLGELISSPQHFSLLTDEAVLDFYPNVKMQLAKPIFSWSDRAHEDKLFLIIDYKNYKNEQLVFSLTARSSEIYLLYSFEHEQLVKCKQINWFVTL